MMYDFNADEIFEMAEQLERNGAVFYRDAAEGVSDIPAREMLLRLAEMEDEHGKTFAALRSELTAPEKESTVFDPNAEASLYLQALISTRVFFEKEIDISSLEAILKSAIDAEKDSILFYVGIKDAIPEKLGKDRVDAIIKEEMGHIQLLSKELVGLR